MRNSIQSIDPKLFSSLQTRAARLISSGFTLLFKSRHWLIKGTRYLVIGCQRSAALKKQTRRRRRRARSCPETRNSQKVRNFPYTEDSRAIVLFGTPLKSLQKTSTKTNVFEAFPRLHRAKGPNRATSALLRQRKSWEAAIFVYRQLTNHTPRIPQIWSTSCAARQVGHIRGNTRNNGLQLAMQQCCETSWRKM